MKKNILIIICVLFCVCNYVHSADQITKCEAWQIVKSQVLKGDTSNINVYASNSTYKANSSIRAILRTEKTPDFTSWFFFIDDDPYANWEHPCRYIFVNAEDGTFIVRNNTRPPLFDDMSNIVWTIIGNGDITNTYKSYNRTISSLPANSATNDYAVIINGGSSLNINYERYWRDCSALYSTLVNDYGYIKSHIYVLMSDGTDPADDTKGFAGNTFSQLLDLDFDGTNDIQYAATKQNIATVFNTLQTQMTDYDNLLIFVTDHGGYDSVNNNSYLCLWNGEDMTPAEFAYEVNKINSGKINICLNQCYSGGFINSLQASNRVITTACKFDEVSRPTSNGLYDEFPFHWISALAGRTPYGATVNADSNGDGIVSTKEAFDYASNHDTCTTETPQYSSTPLLFGQYLSVNSTSNFLGRYYNGTSFQDTNASYPIYMNSGGSVQLYSPNIIGSTVSYQGNISPSYWAYNANTGNLNVNLPTTSGTLVFCVQQGSESHYLPIIVSNNKHNLLVELSNGIMEIMLHPIIDQEKAIGSETLKQYFSQVELIWKIEIYNTLTGERLLNKTITGPSIKLDTTGWETGVYVIKVTIGDEMLSEKVFIK